MKKFLEDPERVLAALVFIEWSALILWIVGTIVVGLWKLAEY